MDKVSKLTNALKFLLYSLLFFLPFGVILRINVLKAVYIYPTDIILSMIFLITLILIRERRVSLFKLNYFKSFYFFIIVAILSLVINAQNLFLSSFLTSFLYILRLMIYSSLLFAFNFLEQKFNKIYILLLAVSGLIFVLFGLGQYFLYPDLRNLYYLGWDEHLYRLFSTFLDPNFSGAYFVLIFLLLSSVFLFTSKIKGKLIISIGLILTLISIFLTYSRSTYLMFIFAISLFLFLIGRKKLIIFFFLIFILGIIFLPKNLKSEGVNLLRTASISARQHEYENAFAISKDHFLLGVGFNAYRYTQQSYGFLNKKDWETNHAAAGVPNSYLFVLATTGIVGLIVFLNFWFGVLKRIGKSKITQDYFKIAIFCSIFGVLLHSFFENTLFFPFILIWIFILLGSLKADILP